MFKTSKKLISFAIFIFLAVVLLMTEDPAFASKTVTLKWNPVDFPAAGSDPAQSGYRLYKSLDNGATKEICGNVDSVTTVFSYTEDGLGKFCFFATAYNQSGESDYSQPACAYIGTMPPAPSGLQVIIDAIMKIGKRLLSFFRFA